MTEQLTVGIVGGSLVGTAAAVLLSRQGHRVTVFERSAGTLEDRGHGLGLPQSFLDALHEAGLVDAGARGLRSCTRRVFSVNQGDEPTGRLVGSQGMVVEMQHWGLVYQQLASRAQGIDIRRGVTVAEVVPGASGSQVRLDSGEELTFDLVIGADGYRSRTRSTLFPDARAEYAGYGVWRGVVHESDVDDVTPVEDCFQSVGTPRGGTAVYLVPGPSGEHEVGRRRISWAWYDGSVPEGVLGVERDDEGRVTRVRAVAEGEPMPADLEAYLRSAASEHMPPWHRALMLNTPAIDIAVQGIWDLHLDHYVSGTVALMGDAGSIARPHTASGAVKGLEDAMSLARHIAESATLAEALAGYDAERPAAGAALVAVGRAFGSQQVLDTPDFATMDQAGFDAWIAEGASAMHYAFAEAMRQQAGAAPEPADA